MKPHPSWLMVCALSGAVYAADIPLPDGRVLRNATITAHRSMDVTIKHAAGTAVVRYEALPEDVRREAETKRPGGPRVTVKPVEVAPTTISGQVFVATKGAGTYKFGDVGILALPMEAFDTWANTNASVVELPQPIAQTKTDADGRFTLSVPKDRKFFLFAHTIRRLPGGTMEHYEWHVPGEEIENPAQVLLSTRWRHPFRPVTFKPGP